MTADDGQPLSVSLNGADNVGKTTQLAWLHRGMPSAHLVGTVDAWDPRWREVGAGDFAHWWFVGSSTPEHVELMMGSHAARRAASGPLALEDRGRPMIQAACAATAALKDGLSPAKALRLLEHLAADLPAATPRRELHVLLRRSTEPACEAAAALQREPNRTSGRYADYQRALAEILELQVGHGEYHAVLDIGDAPILDVQQRVRAFLAEAAVDVQPLPSAVLNRLWVLGGMSESGKSTVGELLRDEHGVTRLKIGYLLEVAALRAGVSDPYERWSEQDQAERLAEEVLRFSEATKAGTISLESGRAGRAGPVGRRDRRSRRRGRPGADTGGSRRRADQRPGRSAGAGGPLDREAATGPGDPSPAPAGPGPGAVQLAKTAEMGGRRRQDRLPVGDLRGRAGAPRRGAAGRRK